VRECLKALPHVKGIHDLHVWSVSTTETAMMVHVVRDVANCDDEFLHDVARAMKTRFGIAHSTVQVEHGGGGAECHLASKCAVD
jgi:cobalt-zinc-cadmium efflux system protein